MRSLSKKALFLYIFIVAFLVGRVLIFKCDLISVYTTKFNPIFWIFTAILSYLIARDEPNLKVRSKYDITQTVIIILILYCMIYFSLGLVFGYEKSPYSHELIPMLKNIWTFVVAIGFQEYVRMQLIKLSPKKIGYYAIITLFFIIAEIDFWNISSNFSNNVAFFKYMSQTIVPLLVSNCLFTYLVIMAGNVPSTIYRVILSLITILLPIFPGLNWLIKAMLEIILVIVCALYVNYVDLQSARVLNRRQLKKEKVTSYIPFVIVLIILVCFIGGIFKYQPIAVLSNSMYPTFARGDAVVVQKLEKKEFSKLKKGDILYYSKDDKLVIHRIIEIKETEEKKLEIKTKGDNNNTEDNWIIKEEEIIGKVKFMVPYIGYPSVWVNEMLKK